MISIQATECIHSPEGRKKYTDVRIPRRLLPLIRMQSLGSLQPFRDSTAPLFCSGCGCLRDRGVAAKTYTKNTPEENQSNHISDTKWLCDLRQLYYL